MQSVKDLIAQRLDSDPHLSFSQNEKGALVVQRQMGNSPLSYSKLTMTMEMKKDHCQIDFYYRSRVLYIPTQQKNSQVTVCTAEAISYATKQFLGANLKNFEISDLSQEILLADQSEVRRRTNPPFKA